ncbi:hypothetical protein GTA51_01610 [Desulfovibrio aerotolerans]|uniref:Uncharacterized protein n=1 Tax=Solidesulfovibrio aerotolerans TaxID=295255 RepID=A0A7C9MTH5_9BACT|nr:hypothetical protein [Solidesulfovibrio aerotolerans]MYL81834.1 hypothetical protein [Solidesulfovibrio aerotolerans]
MHADTLAPLWEGQNREPNRWERLRNVYEKLRLVLDMPGLSLGGVDDLLEQLEQRLSEATLLFPEPDWLDEDVSGPEGLERYCANHMGALLDVLVQAVEQLAEERARELALGTGGTRIGTGE